MRSFTHSIAVVFLVVVLAVTGCQQQDTPSQQSPSPSTSTVYEGTIVAMGNSLTAGLGVAEEQAYPAQLESMLQSKGYPFRVVNAGISGETSSGALSRTQWTLTLEPDIVILETGANDGLRGISPDLIRNNINAIVQQLQQHQVVIILAGMRMVANLGDTYTTAFAKLYEAVARTHDLLFMPFFLDGVAGNPTLNQGDGIHPTAQGYRRIVESLYPHVTAAIEQVRQKRLIAQ
jgi:acyl-CoA thioesterase-1